MSIHSQPLVIEQTSPIPSHKNIVWVRESRFGRWFLGSDTWFRYVLSLAVLDFKRMLRDRIPLHGRMLDAGCGEGLTFGLLETHFKPAQIVGIEIDLEQATKATRVAAAMTTPTQVIHASAADRTFEHSSFDMIFSHQLLHHTCQQTEVVAEFYHLLKPGGILLAGESCQSFINSFLIRLLFRHPHMVQKEAQDYVDIVKNAGFIVTDRDVETTRPWWSRRCLGFAQKIGIGKNNNAATEVLIVAIKPLSAS